MNVCKTFHPFRFLQCPSYALIGLIPYTLLSSVGPQMTENMDVFWRQENMNTKQMMCAKFNNILWIKAKID
jgi:hypothetical protein